MTCQRPRRSRERGAALIVVLMIGTLLLLLGTMLGQMVHQDAHMACMLRRRIQAQALAEAGASHALTVLAADFDAYRDPTRFPATELGAGTFDAEVSSAPDNCVTIASTGVVESVSEVVVVDIAGPSKWLPDYAILADQYIRARGNGQVDGSTHSNSYSDLGGTVHVLGNATAVESMGVKGSAAVDGVALGDQPPIEFPELDFDWYYQMACNGGVVLSGNQVFQNQWISPPNGVIWVSGDVTFNGHCVLAGCLVATGDITQSGYLYNLTYSTDEGDLPVLVSRDGDMILKGQTQVEGLLYTRTGDIDLRGGSYIEGPAKLLAGANFIGRGNWGKIQDQDIQLAGLVQGCMHVVAWRR